MKLQLTALAATLTLGAAGMAFAQTEAAKPAANDYGKPDTWLCLPGRNGDACSADQTATSVAADGTLTVEAFKKARDPGIDCFYVYPTVSTDKTPNSDMTADAAELSVVAVQFARFGSVCRTFAPLYRQVTLTALRQGLMGQQSGADRELAYGDVKAAWDWYLAHENKGRGVVLIGHSQGSGVISELVKREIDGKPVQSRIVGVMALGANIPVDDKGMFGSIPSCSKLGQTGCLVSYVSFRDTLPPPATARFGKDFEDGKHAACVNPSALGGGKGTPKSYFWSGGKAQSADEPKPWATGKTVTTPFVTTPGLLTTECVHDGNHTWLKVTTNAVPSDPRTDSIVGDVMIMGAPDVNWGLHLIDMNHSMGNLVEIVGEQAKSWKKNP